MSQFSILPANYARRPTAVGGGGYSYAEDVASSEYMTMSPRVDSPQLSRYFRLIN